MESHLQMVERVVAASSHRVYYPARSVVYQLTSLPSLNFKETNKCVREGATEQNQYSSIRIKNSIRKKPPRIYEIQ